MTLISLAAAGIDKNATLAGDAAIASARLAEVRHFLIENISLGFLSSVFAVAGMCRFMPSLYGERMSACRLRARSRIEGPR
jgi:hypothetical protein